MKKVSIDELLKEHCPIYFGLVREDNKRFCYTNRNKKVLKTFIELNKDRIKEVYVFSNPMDSIDWSLKV